MLHGLTIKSVYFIKATSIQSKTGVILWIISDCCNNTTICTVLSVNIGIVACQWLVIYVTLYNAIYCMLLREIKSSK